MMLLALAIAPGAVICLFFFYRDTYNAEPRGPLLASFLLGAAMVLPAAWLEDAAAPHVGRDPGSLAAYSYGVVGLGEELAKFLVLRFYAFRRKSFDEPLDGIVYAVMISMGFATLENIFYVLSMGLGTALLRMILSVPAHASFAVLMGYQAGRARFRPDRRNGLLLAGLFTAAFFHGSFDFFLFLQNSPQVAPYLGPGSLFLGAVASFLVSLRLARRHLAEHRNLSRQIFQTNHRV